MLHKFAKMLKHVFSVALLSLFAATSYAQSSVTLYGIIDTSVVYASNEATGRAGVGHSGVEMNSSSVNATQFGFRGKEDLGGGLNAIFDLEDGFNSVNGKPNNPGDLFGRQAFVGLTSTRYGTVTLGRRYAFMSDYVSPLSAEGLGWGGNSADHPFDNDDMIRHQSIQNSVRFDSLNYHGLAFGGMYGFSNEAGQFSNDRFYSFGVKYANGPVSLAAAFEQTDRSANPAELNTTGAVTNSDNDAVMTGGREQIWGIGGKYSFGASSIGFVWTHSATNNVTSVFQGAGLAPLVGNDLWFDNFEINGRYFVTHALSLAAAYTLTDGHFDSASKNLYPTWHEAVAQADYSFSRRTDVYLEGLYQVVTGGGGVAAFNASMFNLPPSANNRQLLLAIGLRHRF
ncbi:porin [Paraburkholderia sp. FT54]|uniref:porin n=1 Tax=Paraburkholderia sp. FT54 TaxID=3074437 RepID=UPI002877A78F|nr:porin [Paraburkholderia sp. FT54]WNC89127.1 porin [Paraburkholderia sp. FT54]